MLLEIQTGKDNPILRKKSKEVKSLNKRLIKFIREMEKAMLAKKGVGLAAPQVGRNIRIILTTLNDKKIISMVNPMIIKRSSGTVYDEEGCLSLPGKWAKVRRFQEVTVTYRDEKYNECTLKLGGAASRVVQHEIDHLDGILFTDYLCPEGSVTDIAGSIVLEKS